MLQFLSLIPFNKIDTWSYYCPQAAVLVLFNLGCTLLVFPAVISLDLRRRCSGRVDILCCCLPGGPTGSEWPCCTLPHVPAGHLVHVARRRRGQVVPEPAKKLQAITRALPPDRQQTVTVLAQQPQTPVSAALLCWHNKRRKIYSSGMHMFLKHVLCNFIYVSFALMFIYCRYKFIITMLITVHMVRKYFSSYFIKYSTYVKCFK